MGCVTPQNVISGGFVVSLLLFPLSLYPTALYNRAESDSQKEKGTLQSVK